MSPFLLASLLFGAPPLPPVHPTAAQCEAWAKDGACKEQSTFRYMVCRCEQACVRTGWRRDDHRWLSPDGMPIPDLGGVCMSEEASLNSAERSAPDYPRSAYAAAADCTEGGPACAELLPNHTLLPAGRPAVRYANAFSVAVFRGFFDEAEVEAVRALGTDPLHAMAIKDRAGMYNHHVWRVEAGLRKMLAPIYWKIAEAGWAVDAAYWGAWAIPSDWYRAQLSPEAQAYVDERQEREPLTRHGPAEAKTIFPEIEYIEYDVEKLGSDGSFDVHTDNDSGVTMVAMLSDETEYEGGTLRFAQPGADAGHPRPEQEDEQLDASDDHMRMRDLFSEPHSFVQGFPVRLAKGDALFFRGELVTHGITNVTKGKRAILQMEMTRYEGTGLRYQLGEGSGAVPGATPSFGMATGNPNPCAPSRALAYARHQPNTL
jgi:hypothetical protein